MSEAKKDGALVGIQSVELTLRGRPGSPLVIAAPHTGAVAPSVQALVGSSVGGDK